MPLGYCIILWPYPDHMKTQKSTLATLKKNDWKEMYQNVIIVLSQRNRTLFFFSLPFGFLCFSNFYKEHILLLQSEEFILDFKEIRNV